MAQPATLVCHAHVVLRADQYHSPAQQCWPPPLQVCPPGSARPVAQLYGCWYNLAEQTLELSGLLQLEDAAAEAPMPMLRDAIAALLPAGQRLQHLCLSNSTLSPAGLQRCTQLAGLQALQVVSCSGGQGGLPAFDEVLEALFQQAPQCTALSLGGNLMLPPAVTSRHQWRELRWHELILRDLPAGLYLEGAVPRRGAQAPGPEVRVGRRVDTPESQPH